MPSLDRPYTASYENHDLKQGYWLKVQLPPSACIGPTKSAHFFETFSFRPSLSSMGHCFDETILLNTSLLPRKKVSTLRVTI